MQFYQGFGQRKTEPGALLSTTQGTVNLFERAEHLGNVIFGNTNSVIGHANRDALI